ncbi:hypothetical protein PIB30_018968 [Stylosanthes scabra]|uniref:SWIB domain-containing protein n=1 Tax=Stylosanthes scabra TaxID=79078 RepID=A0ABU6Z5P3_9FABA|nr:hypothetical protein [Stylosanthes scabra]
MDFIRARSEPVTVPFLLRGCTKCPVIDKCRIFTEAVNTLHHRREETLQSLFLSFSCQQPSRQRHPPTKQNCSSLECPPASSEDTIRTWLQTLSSLCFPRKRAAGKRESLEIEEERGANLGRRQRGRKLMLLASLSNLKDVEAELMPLLPLFLLIHSATMCVASPFYKRTMRPFQIEPEEPKKKEKRQKVGKSGFLAPLQLSDALLNFIRDLSDKRKILCDEKLKKLFDVDTFNGFTVTKLLAPHFIKAEQ